MTEMLMKNDKNTQNARSFRDEETLPNKKVAIMNAAIDLFLQQGYSATSVRQIAEKSGSSASLIIYHFGSKQAIAIAYMNKKMHELRGKLMPIVDICAEPELFCCTFVRLYQTVMACPLLCEFYHELIRTGVFSTFFFEDDGGINVSDLILVKRQVQLPPDMFNFYSHYVVPGIEMSVWLSEQNHAPKDEKFDMPFRSLMGLLYVPKEEVDTYCARGKEIVESIIRDNPQLLEL